MKYLLFYKKKYLIIGKKELDITDEIITIINDEIKEFKIRSMTKGFKIR